MIEITCNDRLGKKVRNHEKYKIKMILQVRIKCNEDDTIGDLKKLIAAQTGTKYELFCISVFLYLIPAESINYLQFCI